jgi:hypothetical protein
MCEPGNLNETPRSFGLSEVTNKDFGTHVSET